MTDEDKNQVCTDSQKKCNERKNHLWYDFLKTYPAQFNRQKPIGPYIVYFNCDKANLAVELDGSQHYENGAAEYDSLRTSFLFDKHGLKVLRFSDLEVNQ